MPVKDELVRQHGEEQSKMAEGDFKPELIWGLGKQEAWQARRSAADNRWWWPGGICYPNSLELLWIICW